LDRNVAVDHAQTRDADARRDRCRSDVGVAVIRRRRKRRGEREQQRDDDGRCHTGAEK